MFLSVTADFPSPASNGRFPEGYHLQGPSQYNEPMKRSRRLTAIIEHEDDGFVALCPEMDVASQGNSIEEARANLTEALTLFLETADPSEIEQRFHPEVFITHVEVPVG